MIFFREKLLTRMYQSRGVPARRKIAMMELKSMRSSLRTRSCVVGKKPRKEKRGIIVSRRRVIPSRNAAKR